MLPILDKNNLKYFKDLYKDNDGYIKIFDRSLNKNYFFPASDFLDKDKIIDNFAAFGSDNVYMSLSTFKRPGKARKENLFNVCALAIDCDYHSVPGQEEVTYEDMRWVLDLLFDNIIHLLLLS